jgi:hypothetical protein
VGEHVTAEMSARRLAAAGVTIPEKAKVASPTKVALPYAT